MHRSFQARWRLAARRPGRADHATTQERLRLGILWIDGAGNRVRTGDIQLGKLTLYQLSYARVADQQYNQSSAGRQLPGRKFETRGRSFDGQRDAVPVPFRAQTNNGISLKPNPQ